MAEPLTDAEQAAWRTFIESSWALHTHLEDELRATTGLSMNDYHVLVVLSEAPGRRLRMGELAGRLVFSPSRITYQINSMVKRGWSASSPVPRTAAARRRCSPRTGMAALVAAAPLHLVTVRDSFIDRLDADELAVIARVFAKVRKA